MRKIQRMYDSIYFPVRDTPFFVNYTKNELKNLFYERISYESINRAILTYVGFRNETDKIHV